VITKGQRHRRIGDRFLGKKQLCNMWCRECKEAWNWRNKEAEKGRAEKVKCSACGERDAVIWKIK